MRITTMIIIITTKNIKSILISTHGSDEPSFIDFHKKDVSFMEHPTHDM